MALVNANYEFVMLDVGMNGRISDGGVMGHTLFHTMLKNKQLKLPENRVNVANLNFVFAGDEAFSLDEHVLKPYPQRTLNRERCIFNYRLSLANRVVENAFGIMAARFRIFHTSINAQPQKVDKYILACCMLHNFLHRNSRNTYTPRITRL